MSFFLCHIDRYHAKLSAGPGLALDVEIMWGFWGLHLPDPSAHLWWRDDGVHIFARKSKYIGKRVMRDRL